MTIVINSVNLIITIINNEKNRCLFIRLNREFGTSRSGPATVKTSDFTFMSLGSFLRRRE